MIVHNGSSLRDEERLADVLLETLRCNVLRQNRPYYKTF